MHPLRQVRRTTSAPTRAIVVTRASAGIITKTAMSEKGRETSKTDLPRVIRIATFQSSPILLKTARATPPLTESAVGGAAQDGTHPTGISPTILPAFDIGGLPTGPNKSHPNPLPRWPPHPLTTRLPSGAIAPPAKLMLSVAGTAGTFYAS